jgi:acetyl-CoA acetyltransferase
MASRFNAAREGGFANLGDNPAHTAALTFKVDAADPVTTVRQAMESGQAAARPDAGAGRADARRAVAGYGYGKQSSLPKLVASNARLGIIIR